MRRRKLRHRSASRPCSTSVSTRRSLAYRSLAYQDQELWEAMPELREAVQDKAHELLDMEGHLESATPEES